MIPVAQALDAILALADPLPPEEIPIAQAAGRVLASPAAAQLCQPPFATSVMDGYAVRDADAAPGARLKVVAVAAAGHGTARRIGPGEAIRIFTGAALPEGADRVVIQEDVVRDGDIISISQDADTNAYIRPAGADFKTGDHLDAPRILMPPDIALLASMGHARLAVTRKPKVAILSTGDELVMPGEPLGEGQIIASNGLGLKAMIEAAGAEARLLPIARDTEASLAATFDLAEGADLIVTSGGASVGDHDLVAKVGQDLGLALEFYKVAMRPGKPLMAGRLRGTPMVGLPGNPVSSMVCGRIFIVPALRAMLGLGKAAAPRHSAELACDLPPNGPREHYMRATLDRGKISPAKRQDSGLLSVLAQANALLIRPPHDPARAAGERAEYTDL